MSFLGRFFGRTTGLDAHAVLIRKGVGGEAGVQAMREGLQKTWITLMNACEVLTDRLFAGFGKSSPQLKLGRWRVASIILLFLAMLPSLYLCWRGIRRFYKRMYSRPQIQQIRSIP